MMADLTPDERAAMDALIATSIVHGPHPTATYDAIWRAARAYQAEQDAETCDDLDSRWNERACGACAKAIRLQAKGLT